ncbi:hypothetical protein Acsp03_23740 [Actinomadura sp. NBRC 104412]|uniref:hypothetical protein n=1 Tax=Actinomadura sp. NBRC 104412 TaxID=3032203 RepID=UPI0024A3AE48|nr:hypothetical protein [Actinomadura sp. NBRC 104412]GLZ04908.1 hypothetical protein Acsp03_23740 [Actinomadura sp. NBRC 104412]
MTAQTPATPEISLVEAVWRFRLMSFLIILACVLAAAAATQLVFSDVKATARFAVTDPTNTNNVLRQGVMSGQGYAAYTAQRAAFAGSTPVMNRAAEILKEEGGGPVLTGGALRGRVQTSSKPDGGVVIVTATASTMREAAMQANAVVKAYQEVTIKTNQQQLDKQLATLQATKQKLTSQLQLATPGTREYRVLSSDLLKLQERESGVVSARSNTNDGVQFVDTADPSAAAPSKLPRNAAIGLAIGTILACVVSFLRAAGLARREALTMAHGPATPGPGPAPPGYELPPGYGEPQTGYGDLPPGGGYGRLPRGSYAENEFRGELEAPAARAEIPRPAAPPRRAGGGERSRGGRRRGARDRTSEPPADRPGRRWSDEVNGAASAPPAAPMPSSASSSMPSSPKPPPPSTEALLDRAEALLDRPEPGAATPGPPPPPSTGGPLGRSGSGSGTSSRAKKPAAPKPPASPAPASADAKVAGGPKRSRSKGGAHAADAPADDQAKREIPAELWADGIDLSGDPNQTMKDNPIISDTDAAAMDAAAILRELSEEAEKGKGGGSSSLMRYNDK